MVDDPAGGGEGSPEESMDLEEVRRRLRRLISSRIQTPLDRTEQAEWNRLTDREETLLHGPNR